QLGDSSDAEWIAELRADGTIVFSRVWRGVTDAHLIEPGFVGSAEARKLHKLAQEQAEAYAAPARFSKVSGDTAPEPEPAPSEDAEEGDEAAAPAPIDGAITRPSQLLEAVLATGRKGL